MGLTPPAAWHVTHMFSRPATGWGIVGAAPPAPAVALGVTVAGGAVVAATVATVGAVVGRDVAVAALVATAVAAVVAALVGVGAVVAAAVGVFVGASRVAVGATVDAGVSPVDATWWQPVHDSTGRPA